ncbi:MAG: GcrA cell cycle regulator, partial [Alphaproteobacteria bacterium]|nr:GcrA cell cycle regulator [Alphaproteobacteria bacterium]
MSWNDERVDVLRDLWSQGLSASQIAARLSGVSRNAVIGKAHRLGLEGRPSPIRGTGTGGRRRPRGARMTPTPTLSGT